MLRQHHVSAWRQRNHTHSLLSTTLKCGGVSTVIRPVNDYLIRLKARTGNIIGFTCVTTNVVHEACRKHGTAPTASIAFGRALTGAALMSGLLEAGQKVGLKFEGGGPLKKILAEATADGDVRGYVGEPNVDLHLREGKPDVVSAIGRAGLLTVTKDLGLKAPYEGVTHLYTSEIGEDLAYYFAQSEQTPSAVGVGVYIETDHSIAAAGGFLVQALPPVEDSLIDQLVRQIEQLPPLNEILRNGQTPEQLAHILFAEIPYDVVGATLPLRFRCTCNPAKMERALIALGKKELADLATRPAVDVVCEYCRTSYAFPRAQVQALLEHI
jgi:molecular chaperone Hsp33